MRTITMAAALVVSLSANAGAQEILAGGSLFASPAQNTAVCYVYNAGTTSLTLSGAKLSNFAGTTLALNINTCTGALAAGKSCTFAALNIVADPINCKVVVAPKKTNARGVLELRNGNAPGISLTNVELR